MADENILSLIQNLFIEEKNLVCNQQSQVNLNDNKFSNYNESLLGNINSKLLDSDNSKKLLMKQLSSHQSQVQNNSVINSQNTSSSSNNSINKSQQNATSFYNELNSNQILRSMSMKDNDIDLNDDILFGKNFLLNPNQNLQMKSGFDLLNSNSTTNSNNDRHDSSAMKDLSMSPLSECSLKYLLTPSGNNNSNSNNLYSGFGLTNNSNNLLQNNNLLVSTTNNNILGNNLVNSPISSNNSLLTSNTSNMSLNQNLSTNNFHSYADLILGSDDNFNLGLNCVNRNQFTDTNLKDSKMNAQTFNFDTCTSPDTFVYTEEDRFESQIRSLANEIHSTTQLHMNGLHMRKEGLLQQLEHIKKIYIDVLRKKKSVMNEKQNYFKENGFTNMIDQKNKQLEKFTLPSITFTKPDSTLYKAISTLGFINTPAFGPFCTASGDGLELAIPGVNSTFKIETRNCFNDELLVGRENISIEIIALFNDNNTNSDTLLNSSNESQANSKNGFSTSKLNCKKQTSLVEYSSKSVIPHSFFDHSNGKYTITYNVPVLKNMPQELVIKINVNGLPIKDFPVRIPIQMQKRQNWKRVTSFGTEGNTVGQLCRPWGVAIVKMPSQLLLNYQNNSLDNPQSDLNIHIETTTNNNACNSNNISNMQASSPITNSQNNENSLNFNEQHYLIGIADRSNNRIQLLDYNSKTQQINVINVFGNGPGTRPGMFDRPAGICINLGLGHIIVADKDNHRIQVFSLTGRYLFKFGEKGNRIGQFCYPWDIDSCAQTHQIVVSDTRNRRIQLFTPYGQYITHFSLLLDSPRGVTFLPDKRLVVSDFNKHRILIFDKLICNPSNNGKDASVNNNDNIGFTNLSSPKIIGFGEGSAWGEFLRPQGIAVNGNIIFCADSRNNRICIYNMLTQTFEYLNEELNLDRPSDLSVIDENILVIIDFGNNRLQILQR